MEERSFPRVPLHCPIVFIGSHTVGKGTVTDVAVFGCAVETTTLVRRGDYLLVTLALPERQGTLVVEVAAVRWSLGGRFGLEFMRIGPEERGRLRHLVKRVEEDEVPIATYHQP